MKTICTLLLFIAGTSIVVAQNQRNNEIPQAVVDALKAKYPTAKIDWDREGPNYEAEFVVDNMEMELLVDPTGRILTTSNEIEITTLPATASSYMTKNHPGRKIKEVTRVTDQNGVITYEVEVDDDDYIFDANGNYLRMKKEKIKDPGKN